VGRKAIDPSGRHYGKWTVRGVDPDGPRRRLCLCDPERGGCGQVVSVDAGSLRKGASTQCLGCAGREKVKAGKGPPRGKGRAAGAAERARHGLPPLAPGQIPLNRRGRVGNPALRALCDRAEREGWDAVRLIAEIRALVT
jgi:hypothetical protein